MSNNKGLYFIPIIARALSHDDPKRAMEDAFDEIKELGSQPEYAGGYQQFLEFVNETLKPSGLEAERKKQLISNALQRLMYDLVTDTFKGNHEQKNALIDAFKANPEWSAKNRFLSMEKFPASYSAASSKSSRHGSISPHRPTGLGLCLVMKSVMRIKQFVVTAFEKSPYICFTKWTRLLWSKKSGAIDESIPKK